MAASAITTQALVIGAGPAGLMAAETLSASGHSVLLADRMPSFGRKFLMAGKSGLNLTKREDPDAFRAGFSADAMQPALERFGPDEVVHWAEALGQDVFVGSTGRVFPKAMKASPLLRAWLRRLDAAGVQNCARWRWTGGAAGVEQFHTPDGDMEVTTGATVLALGGASWRRLGSDGMWRGVLSDEGIDVRAFRPANGGLAVAWSPHMARHFGQPIKGIRLTAGGLSSRGEIAVSARGLEGGGIYEVFAAVRDGAALTIDLAPDLTLGQVTERLARAPAKASASTVLRKALRLDPVRTAMVQEFARPMPRGADLAAVIKALAVRHAGPLPLDGAISTAGGVSWTELTDSLELARRPGTFVAGEMLDWEAPTGGYLITGCLATGRAAAMGAAAYLSRRDQTSA